jgi:hypothetical protein
MPSAAPARGRRVLIDLRWGREDARTVTLVGKGITFDTGGLDIKPSSAMLLMKKDMGGAAAALTLAHMIMAQKLNVRLRLLIPTAENSIYPAMLSVRAMCCARAPARRSRSATPTRKGASSSPTPWPLPTKNRRTACSCSPR